MDEKQALRERCAAFHGHRCGGLAIGFQAARLAMELLEADRAGDEELVAADQVGAGPGDRVLLATGTVASRYCMDAPVDAAVVAIVDEGKKETK